MRTLAVRSDVAEVLALLAKPAIGAGDCERAAQLLGAADVMRDARGTPVHPDDGADRDRDLATVCACLSPDMFAAARAEGRAMTLEQAIAYALDVQPSA